VDPGRVEQKADREREDADDERMACAPELPGRALVVESRAAAGLLRRRLVAGWRGLLERPSLVVEERRKLREPAFGHQNWK
jgi:hypothetical protein